MSDFNPLDRAKIPTHRSSFDLSSKKLFTAKVGEILPCYWQIAIPGTKYRISSDWFTRTVPVNTAAYTRIKEYYDFYAGGGCISLKRRDGLLVLKIYLRPIILPTP
jgi:hypothetical protein